MCKLIVGGGQLAYYLLEQWPDAKLASLSRPDWYSGDFYKIDISDIESVFCCLDMISPTVVINTAGISSIMESEKNPAKCLSINLMGPINIMEWIVEQSITTEFIQCSSIEAYKSRDIQSPIPAKYLESPDFIDYGGMNTETIKDEQCELGSNNLYGKSKYISQEMVSIYRDKYSINASCAVFGNFESKMRGANFITQKIVQYAKSLKKDLSDERLRAAYSNGSGGYLNNIEKLALGNVNAIRSWMHARDAARAIVQIAGSDKIGDWVFAGNSSFSIKELIDIVAEEMDLPELRCMWHTCSKFTRDAEPAWVDVRCDLAKKELGWEPTYSIQAIIRDMIDV